MITSLWSLTTGVGSMINYTSLTGKPVTENWYDIPSAIFHSTIHTFLHRVTKLLRAPTLPSFSCQQKSLSSRTSFSVTTKSGKFRKKSIMFPTKSSVSSSLLYPQEIISSLSAAVANLTHTSMTYRTLLLGRSTVLQTAQSSSPSSA